MGNLREFAPAMRGLWYKMGFELCKKMAIKLGRGRVLQAPGIIQKQKSESLLSLRILLVLAHYMPCEMIKVLPSYISGINTYIPH